MHENVRTRQTSTVATYVSGTPTLGLWAARHSQEQGVALGAQSLPEMLEQPPLQRRRFHHIRSRYNLDWTEYTLYWTYACKAGLADAMHTASAGPGGALRLYEESAFDWGAWHAWDAAAAFRDDSFVFTVIQSIGGVDPAWVDMTVGPFLA